MNAINEYARQVLDLVPPAHPERDRIELDLRAHLEETVAALDGSPAAAFDRMGDPRDVARGYLADQPVHYAGLGARVVAFVVDVLAGFAVLATFAILGTVLFGAFSTLQGGANPELQQWSLAPLLFVGLTFVVLVAFLSIAYFPILEWKYGQTLGKYLMGIHVTAEDGLRVSLPAAIVRRIPFFLEFFWIDAIVAFFTERKQRAFDLVARTIVLETRSAS